VFADVGVEIGVVEVGRDVEVLAVPGSSRG
jgi:hypothetical protein